MTRETERCRAALSLAAQGETVSVVCSGDAGVYGMAGLIYELSEEFPPVDIEVIPGVTAALAGASVLGAPLTHDFAVVSLSDLLTPWDLIEKRLSFAAAADFCMALYNPASKKRCDYLQKACGVLLEHKSPKTVCGLVRNIGREGQHAEVMPLIRLANATADMFTTVFIGNAQTKMIRGKMVTPRGYRLD
jgi:precorrin-3B C17-methyltransferase